jgi:aminopeptidase N
MRRRTSLLVTLAVALGACRADRAARAGIVFPLEFPLEQPHAPRVCPFDVLAYGIELELQPAERALQATCRVRLAPLAGHAPLTEVALDFVGLTLASVHDERGRVLAHRRADGEVTVSLAEPLRAETELSFRYGGRPERGLWYAGTRADGSGPALVFSHGETERNRGWFPCFDEPGERATTELRVTMPASWRASASGALVDVRTEGARRTERWRMDFPYPAYLLGLVAGELTVQEGQAREVPLTFLCEPRFADSLAPTFAETDEILAFLADFTGVAYPYPKYSQAAADNFPWGGMENISATTLTPLLLSDERGRRDQPPALLLAHEAAHQWFGDLFTCADWSHLWLNEGFATYCALLYLEATRGEDEFRAQLHDTQEAYLLADVGTARRPTVWNVWKEPDDAFDAHAYQGAAARLHLLRFVLGDEIFRAGVRAYAAENRGRGVTTEDFERVLERVAGRGLEHFFAQWFRARGFPEFAVAWEWDEAQHEVRLAVEQIQASDDGTPEVFELPVEVELCDAAGSRTVRLELDERREHFELPAAEAPLYLAFDPHGWIPKRVREEKPLAEWRALAERASDVNARRAAVQALGRAATLVPLGDPNEALDELAARLHTDASPWVRADAATALAAPLGDGAEDALRRAALEDPEVRVRSAALLALRAFGPDDGLASLAEEAFYAGPSYGVMAAAASLLSWQAPGRAFEFLTAGLELESPHDALATLLLPHLAVLSDARVPAALRQIAADVSFAPTARAAAVQGLASTTRERGESARALVPLLGEDSFHLRRAAVLTLVALGDASARRALADYYPRTRTSEERRAIEGLLVTGEP